MARTDGHVWGAEAYFDAWKQEQWQYAQFCQGGPITVNYVLTQLSSGCTDPTRLPGQRLVYDLLDRQGNAAVWEIKGAFVTRIKLIPSLVPDCQDYDFELYVEDGDGETFFDPPCLEPHILEPWRRLIFLTVNDTAKQPQVEAMLWDYCVVMAQVAVGTPVQGCWEALLDRHHLDNVHLGEHGVPFTDVMGVPQYDGKGW